jgi:hypothetical protein
MDKDADQGAEEGYHACFERMSHHALYLGWDFA